MSYWCHTCVLLWCRFTKYGITHVCYRDIRLLFCRYLPPIPMTLRQAKNADVLPGQWHIPAGTILLLSAGPMMRYSDDFIVIMPSRLVGLVKICGKLGRCCWSSSLCGKFTKFRCTCRKMQTKAICVIWVLQLWHVFTILSSLRVGTLVMEPLSVSSWVIVCNLGTHKS